MNAPNQSSPGNHASNSWLPLRGGAAPGSHPNNLGDQTSPLTKGGEVGGYRDRRGGTMPLGGVASTINAPNHQFNPGMSKMPQPPSAIEPGKGAIPVQPWTQSGMPARVTMPIRDSARRK